MHLFHYSVEKGGHCGRDAMVNKISMFLNCFSHLLACNYKFSSISLYSAQEKIFAIFYSLFIKKN
jgi:hypothetical protein